MPIVSVTAPVPQSRYDIHIGRGLLSRCADLFAPYKGRRAAVVADTNTSPLYSYALMEQLHRAGVESSVIILPEEVCVFRFSVPCACFGTLRP